MSLLDQMFSQYIVGKSILSAVKKMVIDIVKYLISRKVINNLNIG